MYSGVGIYEANHIAKEYRFDDKGYTGTYRDKYRREYPSDKYIYDHAVRKGDYLGYYRSSRDYKPQSYDRRTYVSSNYREEPKTYWKDGPRSRKNKYILDHSGYDRRDNDRGYGSKYYGEKHSGYRDRGYSGKSYEKYAPKDYEYKRYGEKPKPYRGNTYWSGSKGYGGNGHRVYSEDNSRSYDSNNYEKHSNRYENNYGSKYRDYKRAPIYKSRNYKLKPTYYKDDYRAGSYNKGYGSSGYRGRYKPDGGYGGGYVEVGKVDGYGKGDSGYKEPFESKYAERY